jgi:hypothetical protein
MAIYNPGHLAGRQMLGLTSETKQDLVIARLMQVKRKRYIFRLDNVDSIVISPCRYHHSMTFNVPVALEHQLLELKSEIHSTSPVLFGKELSSHFEYIRTTKELASITPHMSYVKA